MTVVRIVPVERCPLCGEAAYLTLYDGLQDSRLGVRGEWSFRRCVSCECIYLHPWPEDPAEAYPASYGQHRPGGRSQVASATSRVHTWMRRSILSSEGYAMGGSPALGRLLRRLPTLRWRAYSGHGLIPPAPVSTLLDFGCGNGSMLAFAKLLGWRVVGVERDPVSARFSRELSGAPVFETLADARLEPRSIAAATMNHVLEHLPNPGQVLREIWQLLAPGGTLGVAVPNWASAEHHQQGRAWFGLEPSRHLMMYEPDRLSRLLVDSGFVVESITTSSLRRRAFEMGAGNEILARARKLERRPRR